MADALSIEVAKLEQLNRNLDFNDDILAVLEDYKLVRLKLAPPSDTDDKQLQRLSFSAALLEYLGVSLLVTAEPDQVDRVRIEETLNKAAELYEYIYTVSNGSDEITRQELYWGLHASLCYTLGGTAPNSQFIAAKIGGYEPREPTIISPLELYQEVDRLSILLLGREISQVVPRAQSLLGDKDNIERLAIEKLDSDEWGTPDIAYLAGYIHILQALSDAAEYLLQGAEAQAVSVGDELASAEKLFMEIHAAEEYRSTRLLRLATAQILEASIWRRLAAFTRLPRQSEYLERLASRRKPLIELWKSQLEALDAGVLDLAKNRIALSMPTSSGKTLIAEMAMIQTLTSGQPCVYVVPTRALTTEVRDTLQEDIGTLGYRVVSTVGTIEWHAVESAIIRDADILVLTPEKLDLLIRRKDPRVLQAGLVIVDEGHNIEDRERGLSLELAVVNVKQALPQARILLLSAVLPNAQQLANWLANGIGTALTIEWRPTRLKPGYFAWSDLMGEVTYQDGTRIQVLQKRTKTDKRFSTVRRTTAELAKRYASLGRVLVLTTSKPECEKIAESILHLLDESEVDSFADSPGVTRLTTQIRREIDEGFLLERLVKSGIAYHHADLPPRVRRSVEEILKEGEFQYVVSTTTLAEGVNLPISTVLVHDLKFIDFDRTGKFVGRTTMSGRKYWNVAGRAGRALRDTEGHVILIEPERRWPELDLEEYLNWHLANLEPVESRLKLFLQRVLELLPELPLETGEVLFPNEPLIEQFQVAILHAILEGYLDPSQPSTIRRFINQTLFAYQTDRETQEYRRFVEFTRRHVMHVAGRELMDRQFQEYIDSSGLSINSSLMLYDELLSLGTEGLVRLVRFRDIDGEIDDQVLNAIFGLVFSLREFRTRDLERQKAVLLSWISGKPLPALAQQHFAMKKDSKGQAVDNERMLEDCTNFVYSHLVNLTPWGLYAFQQMVEYIRLYGYERLAGGSTLQLGAELLYIEELSFLPLYAAFGVDDPVATYLCLLGVERIDSLLLTKQYREADKTPIPSLDSLKRWFAAVEADRIRVWFDEVERPSDEYLFQIHRWVRREISASDPESEQAVNNG